jgi:hypothetical protein
MLCVYVGRLLAESGSIPILLVAGSNYYSVYIYIYIYIYTAIGICHAFLLAGY